MSAHSDDPDIQAYAREIAAQAGVGPEEALRIALERHRDIAQRKAEALEWLRAEVWPKIPPEYRGKTMAKEEREEILGYGPDGV